jgi:(R,R)-butanediol dehydrogenase/meso-butanediol dehydrogenase/diacetyl reductase
MRAAVLTGAHTFEVGDVPDPTPREGELVLQVRACGICGSDLKAHKSMPAGTVMGHEFCGDVVAVGPGTEGGWREGTLVAALPIGACGHCRWCLVGEPAHCETADLQGVGGSSGGFAELTRVQAAHAFPLGEAVGPFGALVEPLAVGLHAVVVADVRPGDRVLVIGGGNVGAAVAVWARRLGALEILVSDPSSSRRDAAATFGATGVHDPGEGPPPTGFDVVIECVGAPGMLQTAIDACGVHGRIAIAGVCTAPDPFVPVTALMKEVDVRCPVNYARPDFATAVALLESGGMDADAFVTGHVGLDGVDGAFRTLLAPGTTERKILVVPDAGT